MRRRILSQLSPSSHLAHLVTSVSLEQYARIPRLSCIRLSHRFLASISSPRLSAVRKMASFDPSAAAQLDEVLKKHTQDPYTQVPRVVVAAASSKGVLYAGKSGYEQLPPHPATPEQLAALPPIALESIFDLWSATKLVAVVAILQLIEQGLVGVEDPAELFVPEAKNLKLFSKFEEDGKTPVLVDLERPVTVEMLMTHTAG